VLLKHGVRAGARGRDAKTNGGYSKKEKRKSQGSRKIGGWISPEFGFCKWKDEKKHWDGEPG